MKKVTTSPVDLSLKPGRTGIATDKIPSISDVAIIAEVTVCNGPMPTIDLQKSVFQVGPVTSDHLESGLCPIIQEQMSVIEPSCGLAGVATSVNFKNILLPTDLSPNSDAAVPFAVALAKQSGGTIHVFHAFEVEPVAAFASGLWSEVSAWFASAREQRQGNVNQLATNLATKTGLKIRPACANGHPALETVKFAQKIHADVIVLSTHGRTGIPHLFLGSIAEKIVRLSPIPVLTVRPGQTAPDEMKFNTILVPTDFSKNATEAMFYALELAKLHCATLILAHVIDNQTHYSETGWSVGVVPCVNNWSEFLKAQSEEQLAKAAALLALKGDGAAMTVLRYGRAEEEICNIVSEFKVDLVVMSTHGHTGFSHLAFGSIAERVLRSCSVPMLTIRPVIKEIESEKDAVKAPV